MNNEPYLKLDKRRYSLNSSNGLLYISKPVGWDEDNQVFKRSDDTHGIFTNLSNNLSFTKGTKRLRGGYDYLQKMFDTYSVDAKVLLKAEDFINGEWETSYIGYFDFSTYSRTKFLISVKFNEAGIYRNIKARYSEDIEVGRLESMDGEEIPAIKERDVNIVGRNIVISNTSHLTLGDGTQEFLDTPGSGTTYLTLGAEKATVQMNEQRVVLAVPMTMVNEVDGNVQTIYEYPVPAPLSPPSFNSGTTAICFYADAPNAKTLNIDINLKLKITEYAGISAVYRLVMIKYKNGIDYTFDELVIDTGYQSFALNQEISYEATGFQVDVIEGDSLCWAIEFKRFQDVIDFGSYPWIFVKYDITKADLSIIDVTYYPETMCKVTLPFEMLSHMLHVVANKQGLLYSKALGRVEIGYSEDGEASWTGVTNGFKVRQFTDRKIVTSISDFMKSFNSVWQLGAGIERFGNKEYFRVEHVSHFYQDFVVLKLGVVDKITRTPRTDYVYSSIQTGFQKPNDESLYEEAQGLDEFNLATTYTTPITAVTNKLDLRAPYRADGYGMEFARRKPVSEFYDTDTRYDEDIMIMDLKKIAFGEPLVHRTWADDFVVPPNFNKFTTGINSPETAVNLRFSPASLLLKAGYWITACLAHNQQSMLRYSVGTGNSELKKTAIGSDYETAENKNVNFLDLDRSFFKIEKIEFEYKVDREMLSKLKGYRIINGDKIMNYYGLVEFINEDGYFEYGYLVSLEPKGDGKWELLAANKPKHKSVGFGGVSAPVQPPGNLTGTHIGTNP
jgi:hypothetical protein